MKFVDEIERAARRAKWMRIDAGDGSKSSVEFETVYERVADAYRNPWVCIKDALHGEQIRCPFAYYAVDPS